MSGFNRRDFLGLAAATGAAAGLSGCCAASGCAGKKNIRFGICIGGCNLPLIAEMAELGYDYFEGSVGGLLIPEKTGDDWKKQKEAIASAKLPTWSCNGFLPGKFRLTGPEETLTWDAALDYARIACERADEVGVRRIVFGSGGARNIPSQFLAGGKREGFPLEDGRDQFIEFNRKLADRIKDLQVEIVIEPLCPNESNLFNYVWQGTQLVDDVKSPRIRVLADFYHMSAGRESVQSILDAGPEKLRHCHVGMPKSRCAPGVTEPGIVVEYFKALQTIGYKGGVSIESSFWNYKAKEPKPAAAELKARRARALALMRQWAGQA